MSLPSGFLEALHLDYARHAPAWRRGERLMAGGGDVYDELIRYTWEPAGSTDYAARQAVAVYPDLPAQCAEEFAGTLFQSPPAADFGGLLDVRATADREGTPSRAEMVYDNTDGTGEDARGWDAFWYDEMVGAMATGHRWGFAEAPAARPGTLAGEIAGLRPYLVGLSPLSVPNWQFSRGRLDFARIVTNETEARTVVGENGSTSFEQVPVTLHYVLVRQGFTGLGDAFAGGGWWYFDADGKPVANADGTDRSGTWADTGGEIPLWRLYYDRPDGRTSAGDKGTAAPLGRVGLSHLGQCAVALMNLTSALFNDAWVAGSRKLYFLGVDPKQWAEIVKSEQQGSLNVPVPGPAEGGGKVDIYDSGETAASSAILAGIEAMKATARQLIRREAETSAESSGRARQMAYKGGASPRLASMAMSLEDAQNIALRRLQQRWGVAVSGGVTWPKEYDLRGVTERALAVVEVLALAKASSPSLVAAAVAQAADKEGLLSGGVTAETVEAEVKKSLAAQASVDDFFASGPADVFASGDGQTDPAVLDPETGGNA